MTDVVIAEEVPGFVPALQAVQRLGGVLLSEQAAWQLTIVAVASSAPHAKAETLADIADDLAEWASFLPEDTEGRWWLNRMATMFDNASFQIREALDGRSTNGPVLDRTGIDTEPAEPNRAAPVDHREPGDGIPASSRCPG